MKLCTGSRCRRFVGNTAGPTPKKYLPGNYRTRMRMSYYLARLPLALRTLPFEHHRSEHGRKWDKLCSCAQQTRGTIHKRQQTQTKDPETANAFRLLPPSHVVFVFVGAFLLLSKIVPSIFCGSWSVPIDELMAGVPKITANGFESIRASKLRQSIERISNPSVLRPHSLRRAAPA